MRTAATALLHGGDYCELLSHADPDELELHTAVLAAAVTQRHEADAAFARVLAVEVVNALVRSFRH